MADTVIGAIVDLSLSKAISILEEQINLAWEFKDELYKLHASLAMTQAFLQDAETKQLDGPLKVWLEQLRGIASEADDVLDELAYEHLRKKVEENQMRRKVSNFFSPSKNPMIFTVKMAKKVRKMTQSMDGINDRASKYGLQQRLLASASTGVGNQTHIFDESSKAIGRDNDAEKVADLLSSSTNGHSFSIVSIVGMAGLGKTTLAKLACKNERVRNRFNKIMWVCVAENFDAQRILQEMVESSSGQTCELKNESKKLEKPKTELKGKTNVAENFDVQRSLQETVESPSGQTCELKHESKKLEKLKSELKGKTNVAENFDVQRSLQETVESPSGQTCELKNRSNILEKLKKELKGKTYLLVLDDVWDVNFKNWEDLRGSLLGINEASKGCSILVTTRNENVALVRETLPKNRHHLKAIEDDECWSLIKERAFANSSISQELEVIGRDIARKCKGVPLVAAVIGATMCNKREKDEWVSIRDSSLWGSIEGGEDILSVLKLSYDRLPSTSLKQCFVYCSIFPKGFCIQKEQLIQLWMAEGLLQQPNRNSVVVDEDIGDKYFMNLLSNSLLQDVELDDYGCISTCKMHDLVHDLARSIQDVQKLTPKIDSTHDSDDGSYENALDNDVKLWHSLFLKTDVNLFAGNFNGLRVLSFCEANISSLPDSIGGLKHLRYFDISGTEITTITKSLTKLYHLQTFRLLECYCLKFPEGIKNLVSLRHLYISCDSPVFDDIAFYEEIKCLTSLQTLPKVEAKIGFGVLESLNALAGELIVTSLEFVRNKEEARKAKLWEKKKLHKLDYEWGWKKERDENKDAEVLEGLEPHPNLKSLTICGYKGGQYPSWFPGMGVNLVELRLISCENLKSVPTLGQYLNLKFLEIGSLQKVRSIGNEFYHTSDQKTSKLFPSLEVFSLYCMGELEEWLGMEAAVFPSLKELEIYSCPELISIPIMSRFSSLESLVLYACSKLRWSEDEPFLFPSRLRKLEILDCSNLNCIPSVESGISSLQELYVSNCEKLSAIEEGLLASTVLRDVCVLDCPSLTSISFNGGSQSLVELEIVGCDELREIKGGLQLQKLKEFTISNCRKLVSIPSMEGFSLLSKLRIDGCKELVSLPSGLQTCTSLEILWILDCSNLKSIPAESLGSLTSLKKLLLGGFSEDLEEFPGITSFHSSVRDLTLRGWEKLSSLPHQLQHCTALEELTIESFNGMKALPEWLGNLSSLRRLEISECDKLEHLLSEETMQRLPNLRVTTNGCAHLKTDSEQSKSHRLRRILETLCCK